MPPEVNNMKAHLTQRMKNQEEKISMQDAELEMLHHQLKLLVLKEAELSVLTRVSDDQTNFSKNNTDSLCSRRRGWRRTLRTQLASFPKEIEI